MTVRLGERTRVEWQGCSSLLSPRRFSLVSLLTWLEI